MGIGGRETSTPAAGTGAAGAEAGAEAGVEARAEAGAVVEARTATGGPISQRPNGLECRASDSGGGGGNSGEDNGGAVEEMDQDGSGVGVIVGGPSGRVYPADWETKTRGHKKKYWKRRRPSGRGLSPP